MDMMWWFIKVAILLHWARAVRITRLAVPAVVQAGRAPLTLDCEFEADNVTGLVVQWFRGGRQHLVYQWIPPHAPQALGVLRDRLDLSYRASPLAHAAHRALRVTRPEPELSGDYTCVVSTFLAEDERTAPMTIFVPERRFELVLDRLRGGFLNVICAAEGAYPAPQLRLLLAGSPLNAKISVRLVEGRYTALGSAVVRADALPAAAAVLCELRLPAANYCSRRGQLFYRDPPPTSAPATAAAPALATDRMSGVNMVSSVALVMYYCYCRQTT